MQLATKQKIQPEQTNIEKTLKRLKAIEEISNTCSALFTSDLALASHKVLQPFCELTDADYGIVFLLRDPDNQMYVEAVYGLPEEYKETRNNKKILNLYSRDVRDNWPSIRAMLRKQIVIIKNMDQMNMSFSKYFMDTIKPDKVTSVAAVPIIINEKAVGTITKYYIKPHAFDDEELSFMRTTANIITNTIEKNYLLESAKKSEKELALANDVLRQVNQELDSFVYIASHDLREPLRTIESFVSVIQDDSEISNLNRKQKDCLSRIVNATQRMRNLIEDLTNLARVTRDIKEREHEIVDLNILLIEVQFELTAFIDKNNAKVIAVNKLPSVVGNKEKIKSVFKNLISNGIKFNKSKVPLIQISTKEDNTMPSNKVCICITDNGIGIDKKYYEKIFGLFQRLHTQEEYEGTGAGLAIVKKRLEKYNCEIWLESELEKGSKFFFTLIRNN
ncbi:MAG: hypothetical protein A3I68_02800 [Candidatus Melainabacteria bacterium RIFCSPLOWO2_02_FULL_35_15]|nr:MAG: hypothetical protein A3F80_02395 [Candidatus Melainabacteria bacterium RIFCSPLOWO2_12_FULL_35_11]OGI13058.1 MAG: hypothetical protein A3I68_02800 [Candidatus Melainabacteria bacterium RIFCSPLOWO2_02_FULL_35_15]